MATELYFYADDGNYGQELWKLRPDGTVIQVADINPGPEDSNPFSFTEFFPFNGSLYFSAVDGASGSELWKVKPNGSIARAGDVNVGPASSEVRSFTFFNGAYYFNAEPGNGVQSTKLFKLGPDSTVTQISDVLRPGEFTDRIEGRGVFHNAMYFSADDGLRGYELWKVKADGSVAFVAEIDPGAVNGVPSSAQPGSDTGFTHFNNELYFDAHVLGRVPAYGMFKITANDDVVEASVLNGLQALSGLTVFNGDLYFSATAFGAVDYEVWRLTPTNSLVRITDIDTTGVDGDGGSQPGSLSGFMIFNGELYFDADDHVSGRELWKIKADGSYARVADINPGSGASIVAGDGFTVFNGEMYFDARDDSHGSEPWKVRADGSLVMVADINTTPSIGSRNGLSGIGARDLGAYVEFADELYFAANGPEGRELWKIKADGSVALVADINTHLFGFSNPFALTVFNATQSAYRNDFNGDGHDDLLLTSTAGSGISVDYGWHLKDRALGTQGGIELFPSEFILQVTGDFDGDGKTDVVLRNAAGGVWMWQLDGIGIKSQGAVDVSDNGFALLGSGDFDADGKSDLLYRNDAGLLYLWEMNGNSIKAQGALPFLDPAWHVQGVGDFDGDGRADLLLRNLSNTADNGAYYLWNMNGMQIVGEGGIGRADASAWHTLGTGDFDGDGLTDIALRHDVGAVYIWLMDNNAIKEEGAAGIASPATWQLQGFGDYNGDGKSDIMWRNDAGYFYSWDMDGTTIKSEGLLEGDAQWADPAAWKVVGQHFDLA